ncbi:hypothetical protein NON27_29405, partial [Vibrio parahaemolyticus]|nr:hypothetical protein [Vibrio parahaemolyticus]
HPVNALTFDLPRGMSGVARSKRGQGKDRGNSAAFFTESRKAAAENLHVAIEMAGKNEIPSA